MNFYRFPWKIFFRVFGVQFLILNLLVGIVVVFFDHGQPQVDFTLFILGTLALTSAISFLIAYQFSRPLHKLLIKTLHISSKKRHPFIELDKDELFVEEIGEYADFEKALNRIDQKLVQRKEKLLREREENQAFFNSVEEGLISLNLDQKILFYNLKFENLFIPQDLKKLPALALTDVFRQPEITATLDQVVRLRQNAKMSISLKTLQNQERHFLISWAPLRRNHLQEVYGVLGTFHDMTDVKMTEQIRIDFVGNASHELRTPLTSIKGYIETLKSDLSQGHTEDAKKFVDIISGNVDRLIDLVNDLLSLSTLDSSVQLQKARFSPIQLTTTIIEELSQQASQKNIRVEFFGEVDELVADERKVEQVLRNLIANAIKYIPEGRSVKVHWLRQNQDVILKVIDNGPGISQEHHARLFERFYRVDRGRSRDQGGTGLGLAIVKHIMQNHGGRVEIKSQLGHGTEFICSFPSALDSTAPLSTEWT